MNRQTKEKVLAASGLAGKSTSFVCLYLYLLADVLHGQLLSELQSSLILGLQIRA